MLRNKLSCFLLILIVLTLTACSNNRVSEITSQTTLPNEPESISEISERNVTLEEYDAYQSLLTEQEFRNSQQYHKVQITSWQFAKACLSDDIETINSFLDDSAQKDVSLNIFNDLEFVIIKNISEIENDNIDGGQYAVSCEFLPKGDDSYSYLTIRLIDVDGTLKVSSYAFEK